MASRVLKTIKSQIKDAESNLRAYRPNEVDWPERAISAAQKLVPWLELSSHGLKDYVQDVLNAPAQLRALWVKIRSHVNLPREQLEAFDRQLSLDDVLRESVTGEVISKVVTKYLLEKYPGSVLKCNGRSDYPDLYLSDMDYAVLPSFTRKGKKSGSVETFGAALKGSDLRPVRVPDGLEIKTCRDRIAVDCHHAHAGLHLVLLYSKTNRFFTVQNLCIAFLQPSDYRESERNTTATTVKYSFGGERFVSILHDE